MLVSMLVNVMLVGIALVGTVLGEHDSGLKWVGSDGAFVEGVPG